MYFQRPCRTMREAAHTPSELYSATTQRSSPASAPVTSGSRLCPSIGATHSGGRPSVARSISVGSRSTSDTGAATRRGAKRPGADTTSGTRAESSKKHCLNHMPRSPSISPWSPAKTTTVSSARPVSCSTSSTRPIFSST